MENIIKTYPCGLRLIVRHMPNFKSVATSIYVGVGSRDEESTEFGLSHFVEHMLFKGTKKRTSEQIAQELSNLGIDYNAYTSTNATCYHTKGLASNINTCCDILSDMYFNLKFADEDFYRECEVIVQEILMRDDNPRMALSELASETFYAGTPYGHNIAGTVKSVRSFKPNDIYNYIKKHYTARKTIISFAGDVAFAKAEEMVKKFFLPYFEGENKPLLRELSEHKLTPPQNFVKKQKDTEQQNVVVLFPVMNNNHPDKYPMTFVSELFSSDMSSRLFSSVREKKGLVYAITGGLNLTHLGGYYYVYFSCTPKNTELVLETIAAEIKKLKEEGPNEDEIKKVKNIKQADRLFESENVEATNQRNATLLCEFNEIETAEQYLSKINSVNLKDVHRVAKQYLNYDNVLVAVVGNQVKFKPFNLLK